MGGFRNLDSETPSVVLAATEGVLLRWEQEWTSVTRRITICRLKIYFSID